MTTHAHCTLSGLLSLSVRLLFGQVTQLDTSRLAILSPTHSSAWGPAGARVMQDLASGVRGVSLPLEPT